MIATINESDFNGLEDCTDSLDGLSCLIANHQGDIYCTQKLYSLLNLIIEKQAGILAKIKLQQA